MVQSRKEKIDKNDFQTIAQENLTLHHQNTLQVQTITELETQITTLKKLAEKELKSKNRENNKLFWEKEDLSEILEKVVKGYSKKRVETKKLTKIKKVGSLLVEKLRHDLIDLKSELRDAQAEISQLKQENQDLEANKKELNAKIKELKNSQKEQKTELDYLKKESTQYQTTIQQLQTEKTNLEQEKENWQKREQQLLNKQKELLTEIELLKNPPLTSENKENLKQNVVVKEIIKEVIVKELLSEELDLKLSPQEKTKLNELPLQEIENYRNQLVKNKFNHLGKQIGELNQHTHTERERDENPFLNADYSIVYSIWWDGIVS